MITVSLILVVLAFVAIRFSLLALGPRPSGINVTLRSTIDEQPLDIDPALHRVPSIYRKARP